MPDRFIQDTTSGPINIDLSGLWKSLIDNLAPLGSAIWTGIADNLGLIGSTIWNALSVWIYTGIRNLFLGMWTATFLTIPHDVTDQFAPIAAMTPRPGMIAGAGLVLALALLGVRTYLRELTGRGSVLDEIIGRIMVAVSILSMLPWIISHSIEIEQSMAKSIAIADMVSVLPNTGFFGLDTFIALVIAIILGIRLWLKLVSNLVHVGVAIVWSPVALVASFLPESANITATWMREFFGRLAGAVLATIAVALGMAYALNTAGTLEIAAVAGSFLAAHDLVDWLARTPGTGMGGIVGAGVRLGAGLMGGGGHAAVSEAAKAAAMRSYDRMAASKAEQSFYSFD
jgi:hypothetical protein